mgnify:FL=1
MPDVQSERDIRALKRSLDAYGLEGSLDIKVSEKRQWYRADGSPLPNLLPDDDYHRSRFQAKGWTLVPPEHMVSIIETSGLSPIEQEVAKSEEAAKEKEKQLAGVQATPENFLDADDTTTSKENE